MYNVAKKDGVDEHQVNLWTFGKMTIEPIKGAFVFRTRRDKDYSIVYINVCSCDAVPCNAQHSLEGEIIIFMAISQLYKATNDADVYDIAVHPKIIMDINQDKSKEFRAKVSTLFSNGFDLCILNTVSVGVRASTERDQSIHL